MLFGEETTGRSNPDQSAPVPSLPKKSLGECWMLILMLTETQTEGNDKIVFEVNFLGRERS